MLISGILIIVILLVLIISKKTSALTALILVPIVIYLISSYGQNVSKSGIIQGIWDISPIKNTSEYAVSGIKNIAPVAAMFVFAIIFFGVLTDAGMFDPIINTILKMVGNHPTRIVIGAAVLAMLVHLDGSGAVTFIIAIPAMLPLFERLKMEKKVLACVVALGAGTMNIVPWGGPTLRAASALREEITVLYYPIIIPQLCGLAFVVFIAYLLGKKETKRLGINTNTIEQNVLARELTEEEKQIRRPKLFWFNVILTLITIVILISGFIAPAIAFMVGATCALIVNYPKLKDQKERIDSHAKEALMMASILLAAGIFTGIMKDSGMIKIMAEEAVKIIPQRFGGHIPAILAVFSMPLSLFFDPDSFYYGFLPIAAEIGKGLGVPPVSIGQAALMGQMTTGFPLSPLTASTFLLTGLTGVDLADHQKFTFKYAFLVTIVMTIVCIFIGVFPL
jgi:citrate-Mg2+:H+ or citrate-Ca2+:H+ symporter, CitMHS family